MPNHVELEMVAPPFKTTFSVPVVEAALIAYVPDKPP
jgi:hypothetical protein